MENVKLGVNGKCNAALTDRSEGRNIGCFVCTRESVLDWYKYVQIFVLS